MEYSYVPRMVCSQRINFELDGDTIKKVEFIGGCQGNTQAVARLCEGLKVEDAIAKLKGIDCGGKGTSCPDQLARALEKATSK